MDISHTKQWHSLYLPSGRLGDPKEQDFPKSPAGERAILRDPQGPWADSIISFFKIIPGNDGAVGSEHVYSFL